MNNCSTVEVCSNEESRNFFSPFVKISTPSLPMLLSINPMAAKLYLLLLSYSDGNYKEVYPTEFTLAKRMGVCRQTISGLVKELKEINLIDVSYKRKANFTFCNHYRFKRFVGSFIKLPKEIIDSPAFAKIPAKALVLYVVLLSYSDYNYAAVSVPTGVLASETKTSRQTTSKLINLLEALNLIKIERIKGGISNYQFIIGGKIFENLSNMDDTGCKETCKSEATGVVKFERHLNINNKNLESKTTTNDNVAVATYVELKNKIQNPPKQKELIGESYKNHLIEKYGVEITELILDYCSWLDRNTNTKIHNIIGFVKWQFNHLDEIDFTAFFTYLKQLYRKEQAKQREAELYKQKQLEREQEELNKPSPEEMTNFFKKLKSAVGRK